MARLGEQLVASGLLTVEQVQRGLRAQVMWGGRLGTNLVELEDLDLDTLSKALARQRRLPAALERHFEKGDRELQALVPPELADRLQAVPLLRIGPKREQIAVAVMSPLEGPALARLADALGVRPGRIVPSIAPELRIAYYLERVYQIPRDLRFLRPRSKTVPAFLHFEVIPAPPDSEPELVLRTNTQDLPPQQLQAALAAEPGLTPPSETPAPATAPAPEPAPRRERLGTAPEELELAAPEAVAEETTAESIIHERRRYLRPSTEPPLPPESEQQALGRIALRRISVANTPGAAGETLVEATRAIRRSTGRDAVADLVMDAIDRFLPACDAAILLVRRGDIAISWKGFGRGRGALPEIGIPLDEPSAVARAMDGGCTARAAATEQCAVDAALCGALGGAAGELALVPISISGQVMCALALSVLPETDLAAAESIAGAAGVAFARLMRDASR